MLLLERLAAIPSGLRRSWGEMITDEIERRRLKGVHYANGAMVRGARNIKVGRGCFFDHRSFVNCAAVNGHPGFIEMGDNVEIGPYSILWGGGGIRIGSDVHLGAHVHITSMEGSQVPPDSTDPFKPLDIAEASVTIGSHVLICSNSVVVPGVKIGHHAMVAAGAVVTQDVPPYALVAGVPARVIRYSNALPKDENSVAAGA